MAGEPGAASRYHGPAPAGPPVGRSVLRKPSGTLRPMPRIHLLTDHLVSQIAAGEVVERPASVVKELVENALDAGATEVEIELASGGKRRIRVVDDGSGMGRDDALLAFDRHATSKIEEFEDLERVGTLGFRGEALASIAAVSRVELLTAEEPGEGHRVRIEGGRVRVAEPAPRPRGTTIEIASLFFNVPARRKFLKTPATELRRAVEVVQGYALARPDVRFQLRHEGRSLLDALPADAGPEGLPPGGAGLRRRPGAGAGGDPPPDPRRRRDDLGPGGDARHYPRPPPVRLRQPAPAPRPGDPGHLLPLRCGSSGSGTTTRRSSCSSTCRPRRSTSTSIHRRPRSGSATRGWSTGWGRRCATAWTGHGARRRHRSGAPRGRRPRRSPGRGWAARAPAATVSPGSAAAATRSPGVCAGRRGGREELGERSPINYPAGAGPRRAEAGPEGPSAPERLASATYAPLGQRAPVPLSGRSGEVRPFRLLGQYKGTLILLEGPDGLYLIDQHVAHERILYERFRRTLARRNPPSQHLVEPALLELSKAEAMVLLDLAPALEVCGFGVVELSGGTVALTAVPAALGADEAERLLLHLAAEGGDGGDDAEALARRLLDGLAADLSCKAAVKMHHPLTADEMEALITELFEAENPYACPHGRPVVLKMDDADLERRFGRR